MEILRKRNILLVLAFSILAFAVMGFHPGVEDDAVYLSAVKSDLNPALYPHDAQFFRVEMQATLFDNGVAGFVHLTRIPLPIAELLIQFASVFLILLACWSIASHLFPEERARWAGVALTAAMLTLPVAGTALSLADQYLHPRNIASGLILLAVARILAEKRWQAVPLLLLAFAVHPIMAALGISFCFFLTMALLDPVHAWLRSSRNSLAAAVPLGWLFDPPTPAWHRALDTRRYYFLFRWTWYEWLGALAPLFLFWLLWRMARKRGKTDLERDKTGLARFALAVLSYGIFQMAIALAVTGTPALIRLTPFQPMRFLHLIYIFLTLVGGCLLGKFVLRSSVWRWATFLVAVNGGMLVSQLALFPNTPHLELPGSRTANPWLQAFAWVREYTPVDAYFAMDPHYLEAPGEDFHSFRALAERSQLADAVKDNAVVTQVPGLAPTWERQSTEESGWSRFRLGDFERLKTDFGVDWVLVSYPQPPGLACAWHNGELSVCRIP